MMHFVEALLDPSEQATQFRNQFGVLVFPNANPDGVDAGHWRHNDHGVDLNRDWSAFNQPETQAIKTYLQTAQLEKIVFFVDFHSTYHDVFYLLDDGASEEAKAICQDWIGRISTQLPEYQFKMQQVSSEVPASMNWIHAQFKAPAVTYEVGDGTNREQLKETAETAAQALMYCLLEQDGQK